MQGNSRDESAARIDAFISYSHDSQKHKAAVLNLAQRLRSEGVECELDQFHQSPPEGWAAWTLDQIEQAKYVLVLCTQNYESRFRGQAARGVGKGAKWEGAVITQRLFDSDARNAAYIPVVLNSPDIAYIPAPLRGATYYDLSQKNGFTELLRRLTAQPRIVPLAVAPKVRRLNDEYAELEARRFEKEVTTDAAFYKAKLESWPSAFFGGEEIVEGLESLVDKVESNPAYRSEYPAIWATVYRMLGGAYLIHSKLDMMDKLLSALPSLRRSLELWPEQACFAENIRVLETIRTNSGGDFPTYLTAALQILRGPGDPQIPTLVEQISGVAKTPERQAQDWLLHQATPNPVWNSLLAMQHMIKKERNLDVEIEVSSKLQPDGLVEVQVVLGPNILLWVVNFARKHFEPANDFTRGITRMILGTTA